MRPLTAPGASLLSALAAEEVALALLEGRELGRLRLLNAVAHLQAALRERARLRGRDILERRGEHEGDEHEACEGVHLERLGGLKGLEGGGGGLEFVKARDEVSGQASVSKRSYEKLHKQVDPQQPAMGFKMLVIYF